MGIALILIFMLIPRLRSILVDEVLGRSPGPGKGLGGPWEILGEILGESVARSREALGSP